MQLLFEDKYLGNPSSGETKKIFDNFYGKIEKLLI